MLYTIKDKEDIFANIVIADAKVLADETQAEFKVKVDDMVLSDGRYKFVLNLPYGVTTKDSHNMYFRLMNRDGYSLTQEAKSYIKANKE
jgi:hypothetical protein